MNLSQLKKLFRSPSFTSWLNHGIAIAGPLIIIPLMSKVLSASELALWLLIGTITGLGLLADFGFSSTITRVVAYYQAGLISIPENEQDISASILSKSDKINTNGLMDLIATSRKIYIYITLASLLILVLLGVPMVWNVINMSNDTSNLWAVFAIGIIYVVISIHSSRWFGIAQGFDLIHRVNIIRLIAGIIEFFVFGFFILFKLNLIFYVILYLFKAIFFLLSTEYLVSTKFRLESGQHLNGGKFNNELFKIIWRPTRQQGIIFLGSYLINQGNSIVIAQTNDPIAISAFLFIRRILDAVRAVSQVPFSSNVQNIYKAITTKSSAERKNYLVVIIMTSIFLMIFFLIATYFMLPIIFSLFNSEIQIISGQIFFIMAISLLLESHHSMHATIYAVTNKVPFVWQSVGSGILIFGASMFYTIKYGILGIVITQFIVQLLVNNWYPVYLSLRMLNWPLIDYLKSPIYFFRQVQTSTVFKEL